MLVSQLLSKARVRASQFGLVECTAPWSGRMPASDEPVIFAILDGSCLIEAAGETERLEPGDVALLTRGSAYRLCSSMDAPDRLVTDLIRHRRVQSYTLREGGGGKRCLFLAAHSTWDDVARSTIVRLLPELVIVRRHDFGNDTEAAAILAMLAREAERARDITPIIANDLLNILLHEMLFIRFQGRGIGEPLMSSFDRPAVAKALMLIHSSLAPDWTVATLAQRVGMSRSAFTVEFTAETGRPPGQYLTSHKLETAAQLLRESSLDVGAVADRVGYASMPSFIKAFKRRFGTPPGRFRSRPDPSDAEPARFAG